MSTDEALSDLLLRWQEIYEREGRDTPAGELCRDHPELEPELRRQIDILKRMGVLADGVATEKDAPAADDAPKTRTMPPPAAALPPGGPADAPLPTWLHNLLDPPRQPDEAGRLGRYRILRLLGEGGMGSVLLAEDPLAARRVALKVMKPDLAGRPAARWRFQREARAAAALAHDNVVPVYHVDEVKGMPYIVMPLLQGENLEDRLKRQPRPPLALTVQVGREVAEGLAAAHAAGLVHRDIKPANLWLETLPRPGAVRARVLDFGLARPLETGEHLTESGAVLGTPAYMAPEQAAGETVAPASDLFSLGAVLYRMAAGKHAFDGTTLPALLRCVAETDPPPPHKVRPDVPRTLSDLIMAMLAKDPARRPASARAVADALHALAVAEPESLGETLLDQPKSSPHRPAWRRLGKWVTAGALVAGVVLLAVMLGRNLPTQNGGANGGTGAVSGPLTGELTVYFGLMKGWEKKGRANRAGRIQDDGALPLRPGQGIRVAVKLNAPAYVYLVSIDSDGDVTPLYPWDPPKDEKKRADLREPPPKVEPSREVYSPQDAGDLWPLQGDDSGLETILLLARRAKPLGADVNLADLIALKATPLLPEHKQELLIRGFENRRPQPSWDQDRRPEARLVDAPFEEMLSRLAEHFEVVRAVRFAYQNK